MTGFMLPSHAADNYLSCYLRTRSQTSVSCGTARCLIGPCRSVVRRLFPGVVDFRTEVQPNGEYLWNDNRHDIVIRAINYIN